jgi:hypothetical protein
MKKRIFEIPRVLAALEDEPQARLHGSKALKEMISKCPIHYSSPGIQFCGFPSWGDLSCPFTPGKSITMKGDTL